MLIMSSFCRSLTASINAPTLSSSSLSSCQCCGSLIFSPSPRSLSTSLTFSLFISAPSSAMTEASILSPSTARPSIISSFAISRAIVLPSCLVMTLSSSLRPLISETSAFNSFNITANFSASSGPSFKALEACIFRNASLSAFEAGLNVKSSSPSSVTNTLPSVIMALPLILRTLISLKKPANSSGDTGSNLISCAGTF